MTIKTAIILVLQDKSLLKYNKQSSHMAFQTDLSNLVNQKPSQHKENTGSEKPCHWADKPERHINQTSPQELEAMSMAANEHLFTSGSHHTWKLEKEEFQKLINITHSAEHLQFHSTTWDKHCRSTMTVLAQAKPAHLQNPREHFHLQLGEVISYLS